MLLALLSAEHTYVYSHIARGQSGAPINQTVAELSASGTPCNCAAAMKYAPHLRS